MKLTINKKMMLGFGLIIALMILANGFILYQLLTISKAARVTLGSDVRSIDFAKQLQSLVYEQERNAQKFLIVRDNVYRDLFLESAARFDEYVDSLNSVKEGSISDSELTRNFQRIHDSFVSVITFLPPSITQLELTQSNHIDSLHLLLDTYIRDRQLSIDQTMAHVETITRRSTGIAVAITFSTFLIALILAFFIPRTITKPITMLIRGTEEIARGKFDPISVTSRDEMAHLAEAINEMSARLKRINELKAELLQHITHEFRTPLQTILAALYLLKDTDTAPALNPDQEQLLASIRTSVDRLTRFTNQMLDVAKAQAGQMEYHLKPTDLPSLLRSVLDESKLVASSRHISLNAETQAVPALLLDEEKMRQVFTNLISNAIKYTNEGGTVTARIFGNDASVTVTIRDTGIGIAPDELGSIFDRFYQASNVSEVKHRYHGSGLGLALVKAFTEGHGGTIYVESTVGSGTTFTLSLPILSQNAVRTTLPSRLSEG